MLSRNEPSPEVCPVCGEDVPPDSKACPDCGACHESGWNDLSNIYDAIDLPNYGYADDEKKVVRTKFRQRKAPERKGLHPAWRIVALVVVLAMFYGFWQWLAAQFGEWVR